MPFTFAHPAIFIPFVRKIKMKLSATALIIGSMIPDFEFFLKMKTGENIGHHWYGILLFDIPLAIICCYVFHNLLRDMLINQSPQWFYQRFSKWKDFDWNSYAKKNSFNVLLSVIIGIISHLFLDAFTHEDGFFVEQLTFLKNEVRFFGIHTNIYMLLQVLESLAGLYLVYRFIKYLPLSKSLRLENDKYFWLSFGGLTVAILLLRIVVNQEFLAFWDIFMAFMGSLIYSLIFICLFKKINFLYKKITKYIKWQV
jgi:hypothetical protein